MVSGSMFALEENAFVKTVLSICNVSVHILLGMIVGIALLATTSFNDTSVPENIILLHILLCVPGFTLLMTQALLSMTAHNTWSSRLDKNNKRRAHWILQILGSGLGLTGSMIIMIYKDVNFNTMHGQFGLVTFIFTTLNIIIGVAALWSHRLSKFIPPMVSKITHIVLGIVAYASACACLCYAFNKNSFKIWTSEELAMMVIAITGIFTLIILANPMITLVKKVVTLIKSRSEK